MIGSLKGTVKFTKFNKIVVETISGVGYEVEVKPIFQNGELVDIWIYTHVRENEIKLYGFEQLEQKYMFELLITVSGIGPKSAHQIVSFLDLSDIQNAILLDETKTFTKVPGVGKKVSERICLELKDKMNDSIAVKTQETVSQSVNVKEAFDALTMLGYSMEDIREAIKGVDLELPSNELIKICLKKIKK